MSFFTCAIRGPPYLSDVHHKQQKGIESMKFTYKFLDGEVVEVDVSAEEYAMLLALKEQGDLTNRKETRRHVSMDLLVENGVQFSSDSAVEAEAIDAVMVEIIMAALKMLTPEQLELIRRVFFQGETYADIAREKKVNRSTIMRYVQQILRKLLKK